MAVEEQIETERKYDVPAGAELPDLTRVPGVRAVAPPRTVEQVATYYDTPDQRLLAAGTTLRRRVGGLDDGWHLKLPAAGDRRRELRLPPGGDEGGVPAALVDRVLAHVRDRPLVPVAVLTTRRTVHWLLGPGGVRIAELSDDVVRAERRLAPRPPEEWREWEVELLDGPPAVLDAVEPLLLAAGARPSPAASKLGRVLGDTVPEAARWRRRTLLGPDPSTGDLLLAYVAEHLGRLEEQDGLMRSGSEEGVHQLRVAARRIRSALATYSRVVQPGVADHLRGELRWLGGVLAAARDAQVLRRRLADLVAAQPAEPALGAVAARLDEELRSRFHAGRRGAETVLGGERYLRLLDALEALLADPPLTGEAARPATELLPDLLRRDRRRLVRRHRAVESAATPQERDLALHEVRKAAKRLRYAAESAVPAFGDRAAGLAGVAEEVQELLGDHHDSVVTRAILREAGVRAHLDGEGAVTLERLHGLEEDVAASLVTGYLDALARLPAVRPRTWRPD